MVITHDLRMVRNIADRVLVIHRGRIVEELKPDQLFSARHPITQSWFTQPQGRWRVDVRLVTVEQVSHRYRTGLWGRRGPQYALRNVGLHINAGENVGLIGEILGLEKLALAKCIAGNKARTWTDSDTTGTPNQKLNHRPNVQKCISKYCFNPQGPPQSRAKRIWTPRESAKLIDRANLNLRKRSMRP